MAEHIRLHVYGMSQRASFKHADYPVDSVRTAVVARAAQWLGKLQHEPVRGLQLDPSGRVGVVADRVAYAKAQFSARLATPGLPFSDRAYTLTVAVKAFSERWAPARLPTAEAYLHDLDALGDSAAPWQFEARRHLMQTYYLLGRSEDVVRHGRRAITLLSIMPFNERRPEFNEGGDVYDMTIDGLTGQPNAQAQVAQLNAQYRAAAIAPSALIAFHSAYRTMQEAYQFFSQRTIAANAKLGTVGAPLVAHAWVNRASPDSATIPVNDGKIRVVEMAHTGCEPCVEAVYGLQQLHEQFPRIEPIMLTWTLGHWGGRLVEPAEEIAHLTEYFVTNTHVTYPVGIWAGKKVLNEDGGMTPEESINLTHYPLIGKPMLWVLDGHGVIRRIFTGYSKDIHRELFRTIEFLVHESHT